MENCVICLEKLHCKKLFKTNCCNKFIHKECVDQWDGLCVFCRGIHKDNAKPFLYNTDNPFFYNTEMESTFSDTVYFGTFVPVDMCSCGCLGRIRRSEMIVLPPLEEPFDYSSNYLFQLQPINFEKNFDYNNIPSQFISLLNLYLVYNRYRIICVCLVFLYKIKFIIKQCEIKNKIKYSPFY